MYAVVCQCAAGSDQGGFQLFPQSLGMAMAVTMATSLMVVFASDPCVQSNLRVNEAATTLHALLTFEL